MLGKKIEDLLNINNIVSMLILVVIIIFILFIYHYPDYYAAITTPNGMVYLGQNSYFDPWDINFYVSSIHYGQRAGIFLPNLYASMNNQPVLLFPLLTVMGFIHKTINPFILFHIYSIITGAILIVDLFFIIKKLGFSTRITLYSILTICLGGGIRILKFW